MENHSRPGRDSRINLERCPSCGSVNTSVRPGKDGWYTFGCEDCWNHNECDEACLEMAIETWNRRSKRRWGNEKINRVQNQS